MHLLSSKQDRSLPHAGGAWLEFFWCSKFTWSTIKKYWDCGWIWVEYVISFSWKRRKKVLRKAARLHFWHLKNETFLLFFQMMFLVWRWPSLLFLFLFLLFFKLWKALNNLKPECLVPCLWKEIKEEKKHSPLGGDPKQKSIFNFFRSATEMKNLLFVQLHYWKASHQCVLLAISSFHLPRERFVCKFNKSIREK